MNATLPHFHNTRRIIAAADRNLVYLVKTLVSAILFCYATTSRSLSSRHGWLSLDRRPLCNSGLIYPLLVVQRWFQRLSHSRDTNLHPIVLRLGPQRQPFVGFGRIFRGGCHESCKCVRKQNLQKKTDRYLLTVQRTGFIRCLNCIKHSKRFSESISGGGESAQIHFQSLHISPRMYRDGWSLSQQPRSQDRVGTDKGDRWPHEPFTT